MKKDIFRPYTFRIWLPRTQGINVFEKILSIYNLKIEIYSDALSKIFQEWGGAYTLAEFQYTTPDSKYNEENPTFIQEIQYSLEIYPQTEALGAFYFQMSTNHSGMHRLGIRTPDKKDYILLLIPNFHSCFYSENPKENLMKTLVTDDTDIKYDDQNEIFYNDYFAFSIK